MNKILVTAFDAFGGERINPSKLAMEALEAEDVIKLTLPVMYETAANLAVETVKEYRPAAVISLGQAGGRNAVTPEKYAVNLRFSPSPDSAGRFCDHEIIIPHAPEKLESTFDAEKISDTLNRAGIPSHVSESAGTYVCNDVMYSVLWALRNTNIPAGFIHVPYCAAQVLSHPGSFSMEESEIVRAVEIVLNDIRKRLQGAH